MVCAEVRSNGLMTNSTENYPKRPSHFAHKYCRLLAKACAAMELGPDGCWLLSVIAMLEDSKRYSDAVSFYNGQLMAVAGFTREHTLIAVRNRAITAGWLHYEPGQKRHPGRYWVEIPERFTDLPDGPCDESTPRYTDESVSGSVSGCVGKASADQQGKRQPFLPIPSPTPNPKDNTPPNGDGLSSGKKSSKAKHTYSREFERWYEAYPLKTGKLDAAKAYSKAAKEVGHDILLEAVRSFARSDKGCGEYCWHPATWLNQGHWEDDPATWKSRSGNGVAHLPDDEYQRDMERRRFERRALLNQGRGTGHVAEGLGINIRDIFKKVENDEQ